MVNSSSLAAGSGPYDLSGAVDLHVHTAPCLFPRLGDDVETARQSAGAGMLAMAVKSHHESTVSRARYATQAVPDITVVGGVTLNWPVGGVNPYAVEAALLTGGRMVWGPSGHSAYHGEIMGGLGSWGKADMTMPGNVEEGVTVLDERGELTDAAKVVLDLVHQHDAVFATSHLGPTEIMKILEHTRPRGTKVLINHVFYLPRVEEDFLGEVIALGAKIELISGIMLLPKLQRDIDYTYPRLVSIVQRFGAENFVLSSDGGSVALGLWPHEQLRMFARLLLEEGMAEKELDAMLRTNPADLIGL